MWGKDMRSSTTSTSEWKVGKKKTMLPDDSLVELNRLVIVLKCYTGLRHREKHTNVMVWGVWYVIHPPPPPFLTTVNYSWDNNGHSLGKMIRKRKKTCDKFNIPGVSVSYYLGRKKEAKIVEIYRNKWFYQGSCATDMTCGINGFYKETLQHK